MGVVVVAGGAAFVADHRNQSAIHQILENTAAARPAMQGVQFKVPFLKDPPPKKAYTTLYPKYFTWGTDATLKYYDMGEGYWQTNGISLNDGREVKDENNEFQAHLRFKSNPASDPLHPGHSILAMDSKQHHVTFAPLGQVDFDAVRTIPESKWLHPAPNEAAAVWNLKPGDVVGIRVDAVPMEEEATGSKPQHRIFQAKMVLNKLSHESVRFDFVYRNDGKQEFPSPNRSKEDDPGPDKE